jgi:hypothetical protein
LVVGVCGIVVLIPIHARGVTRWTPCHEAQRVANAAAIFLQTVWKHACR